MSDRFRSSHNDRTQVPQAGTGSPEIFEKDIEINPMELLRQLVRRTRLIIGVVGLVSIMAAIIMLLTPNMYTSRATILPSGGGNSLSGFMGIAGTLGLGGTNASVDENSSMLYPSIFSSNLVRDGVLEKEYAFSHQGSSRTMNLKEYFDINDPNKLRIALGKATSVNTDKKLGIVTIAMETEYAELSQAVLNEYVLQLENYLIFKRSTQAGNNKTYLTTQLAERVQMLELAEGNLQGFMEINRNWNISTDPELRMELARLQREVEIQSGTYLLLTKQHELARLEARKDVPIVRILDKPSLPTLKSSPQRVMTVIFAALVALMTMAVYVFIAYLWGQMSGGENEENYRTIKHDFSNAIPGSKRILNFVTRRHSRQAVGIDD